VVEHLHHNNHVPEWQARFIDAMQGIVDRLRSEAKKPAEPKPGE
jgi:hypothetical protein